MRATAVFLDKFDNPRRNGLGYVVELENCKPMRQGERRMRRQLSFIISNKDDLDGVLTAYAREWLLIAASEISAERRSLVSLTNAVGTNRHRVARWLDALRIRRQVDDSKLLEGSDYETPKSKRKVRFTVSDTEDLDGALTAYAREWFLLTASELPVGDRTLAALSKKVGTNRQRVTRWLDALEIRDKVDELREPVSGNGAQMRTA
jgi:hypothetical protein